MPYGVAPPFNPTGQPVVIPVTGSSAAYAIPPGDDCMRIVNTGSGGNVRVAFGTDNTITAVNPATNVPGQGVLILGSTVEVFTIPRGITWLAVLGASAGSIEIQRGLGS